MCVLLEVSGTGCYLRCGECQVASFFRWCSSCQKPFLVGSLPVTALLFLSLGGLFCGWFSMLFCQLILRYLTSQFVHLGKGRVRTWHGRAPRPNCLPRDCIPIASRLRPDCLSIAFLLPPDCVPIASRFPPDCFPIASRLPLDCLPIAYRLRPDCLSIASRLPLSVKSQ